MKKITEILSGLSAIAVAVFVLILLLIAPGCSNDSKGIETLDDDMVRIDLESAELMVTPITKTEPQKGPYNTGYDTVLKSQEMVLDVLWFDPDYERSKPGGEDKTTLCVGPKRISKPAGSNVWNSKLVLKSQRTYRLYAFTPVDGGNATIEPIKPSDPTAPYTDAIVTLKDIPAVSSHDYMYSVGLANPNATPEVTPSQAIGNYLYDVVAQPAGTGGSSTSSNSNKTYLILDHLMSKLVMKIKLDANYKDVRDIFLKEVTVKAEESSAKAFTAKLNYLASSVSHTWTAPNASADAVPITLYPTKTASGDAALPSDEYITLDTVYFIPHYESTKAKSVRPAVTFKFDVKVSGTSEVTRQEVTVTNTSIMKQIEQSAKLAPGKIYTMSLVVKPTYLYVLSDEDPIDINIELK